MEDFLFDLIDLVQSVADGLLFGTTYAMIGIGFTLIFGVMDKLNMSYAAAAIAGAYSSIAVFAVVPAPAPRRVPHRGGRGRYFRLRHLPALFPLYPARQPAGDPDGDGRHAALHRRDHRSRGPTACRSPTRPLFDDVMIELGPFGLRGDLMFVFAVSVVSMAVLLYLIYRTRLGIADAGGLATARRRPALRHRARADQRHDVRDYRRSRRCRRRDDRGGGGGALAAACATVHRQGADRDRHRRARQHSRRDHRGSHGRRVSKTCSSSCAASPSATCT